MHRGHITDEADIGTSGYATPTKLNIHLEYVTPVTARRAWSTD